MRLTAPYWRAVRMLLSPAIATSARLAPICVIRTRLSLPLDIVSVAELPRISWSIAMSVHAYARVVADAELRDQCQVAIAGEGQIGLVQGADLPQHGVVDAPDLGQQADHVPWSGLDDPRRVSGLNGTAARAGLHHTLHEIAVAALLGDGKGVATQLVTAGRGVDAGLQDFENPVVVGRLEDRGGVAVGILE